MDENNKPPKKIIGRPFVPGQSGNPNGRPKKWSEFSKLAREASPLLFKKLMEIVLRGRRNADVLRAIEILLDRGLGPVRRGETIALEPIRPNSIVVWGVGLPEDAAKLGEPPSATSELGEEGEEESEDEEDRCIDVGVDEETSSALPETNLRVLNREPDDPDSAS